MPAIFTHAQFGKEVAQGLPPHLRALTEQYAAPFYLGTQGPDLLFYHKPLRKKSKNPARKKGWDLHAEYAEDFFLNGGKLLLADEGNFKDGAFLPQTAESAYLLGFLCHYVLDTACHPYIDERSVDGVTHGKIESEFDKYQFRKLGRPARGFNAATLFFPCDEGVKASAKILGVTEKNVRVALRSMKKINRLFSHKREIVHGFCHFVLTLAGMNDSFGEMFLHKKDDPQCAPLLPVLQEKFEGAISKAQEVIADYFENLPRYIQDDRLYEFFRYTYSGTKEENA